MGERRRWWTAFFLSTCLMISVSWLICAMPAGSGRLASFSARVAFFVPLAGLCLPFAVGWIVARKTRTRGHSASASGVFVGVVAFCIGLGLQDALLHRTPAALVVMMGVGGMLGLVASLSALVGHVAAMDQLGQRARRASLPRARVVRRRSPGHAATRGQPPAPPDGSAPRATATNPTSPR